MRTAILVIDGKPRGGVREYATVAVEFKDMIRKGSAKPCTVEIWEGVAKRHKFKPELNLEASQAAETK